ncbi:MAG: hypothetical protein NVSMB18_00850 [Acetobacteraceae bacterium]
MRVGTLLYSAVCLAAGATLSVQLGQDANWDLLNYHLYNGYAALHGRFARDLIASGMQSSLNPVLDALYAGLALGPLRHAPRALAAVTGLWFGAVLILASGLARRLYRSRPLSLLFAATALAVTGAATISQVGTATEEVQVATVMLAGLLVMLAGAPERPSLYRIAAAGALFGLAAALKLTAATYAPAALLAALWLRGPRPRALAMTAVAFAMGWAGAVLLADGWWAAMLLQRFGSPTFPMFNGLFRSPLYPPASLLDQRFQPHGLLQWLIHPFAWALTPAATVNEVPLRDPRLALALGLAGLALAALLFRGSALTRRQQALLAFFAAGYASWLATSAILRYAVVLEVTAGLLTPLLLADLLRRPGLGRWATLGVTALVLASTRYPATLRIPYGRTTIEAAPGAIPQDTLLVLTFRGPVSYLVPMLAHQDTLQVINVGNTVLEARGWGLHDAMLRRVREHAGPIMVLTDGHPLGRFPELGEVGLSPALQDCRPVASSFAPASDAGTHLCVGVRAGPRPLADPFWAQAATRYRRLVQIDDGSQSLIGAAYLAAAGPAARGTRFIDWTELLWSGVGARHEALPERLDPATLYVIPEPMALAAFDRMDPGDDLLAKPDGELVLAPGWRRCAPCTSAPPPFELTGPSRALSVGETRPLAGQARASGLLAGGWWAPEPDGIWSREQAELLIPLAADLPDQARLILDGHLLTASNASRARIELVGRRESVTDASGSPISLTLQRRWLRRGPGGVYLARIRLSVPDATSPAALGLNVDPRRLGFWLASVRLEAAPP